jgi:hypothetical protein
VENKGKIILIVFAAQLQKIRKNNTKQKYSCKPQNVFKKVHIR